VRRAGNGKRCGASTPGGARGPWACGSRDGSAPGAGGLHFCLAAPAWTGLRAEGRTGGERGRGQSGQVQARRMDAWRRWRCDVPRPSVPRVPQVPRFSRTRRRAQGTQQPRAAPRIARPLWGCARAWSSCGRGECGLARHGAPTMSATAARAAAAAAPASGAPALGPTRAGWPAGGWGEVSAVCRQ